MSDPDLSPETIRKIEIELSKLDAAIQAKAIRVSGYLQTLFPENSLLEIAKMVAERFGSFGTKVHLLCRNEAMCVIWTGIPIQPGTSPETLEEFRKAEPIGRFIGEFMDHSRRLIRRFDPLQLWLPAHKYDIGFLLPYGEPRGKFIRTGLSASFREEKILEYSFQYRAGWNPKTASKLETVIREWHQDATTTGMADEKLGQSPLVFSRRGKGLAFRIENYEPVTFPWVELYLRLRVDLPKREWPTDMIYAPIAAADPQ